MNRVVWLLSLLFLVSCSQLKTAKEFYDQNDYKETINACNEILAADSTNVDAMALKADAFEKLGNTDSALYYYTKASMLEPENESFNNRQYQLLVQKGESLLPDDKQMALEFYDQAIDMYPKRPLALEKKADLLYSLERYDEAEKVYAAAYLTTGDSTRVSKKIAKIDSINTATQQDLEKGRQLIQAKKYDQAKAVLKHAVETKPKSKEARYQLHIATGLRLYKRGSKNALWEAIEEFGFASVLFPDRAEPYYYMGLAYTKKDKDEYSNAIEALRKAVEVAPDSEFARKAEKEAERITARKKKMDAFWGR